MKTKTEKLEYRLELTSKEMEPSQFLLPLHILDKMKQLVDKQIEIA